MDKKIIARNFSRYARTYDRYADIQRRAASDLLGLVKRKNFLKVLELGCGTGNFTLLLKDRFPDARIKAIDISGAMIEVAGQKAQGRKIDFSVGDAEYLPAEGSFDLVASNACFQWFGDLEKALTRYKSLLLKNGCILFSVFGPQTYAELNASLACVLGRLPKKANFSTRENISNILNKNFPAAQIKEKTYQESFPRLKDLLDKIKYTGTQGQGLGRGWVFTPDILRKTEEAYLDKFGRIKTTYQVFYCRGNKD